MPEPSSPGGFPGPLLRTLAESLDLHEIFSKLSVAAREAIAHDYLLLGLLSEDRKRITLVALSEDIPEKVEGAFFPDALRAYMDGDGFVLNDMQPLPGGETARGWVRPNGGKERVPVDLPIQPIFRRMMLEHGVRSFLRVPVRIRQQPLGGLVFCSRNPAAFPDGDLAVAGQIAACVALAVEHDRLWREERDRRRRNEALQGLLPALARALDIRSIFDELCRLTQDVIPHDYVSLGLFNDDRTAIRVHATSEDMGALPEFRFTDPSQARAFEADFMIASDIELAPPDGIRVHARLPDPGAPPIVEVRPGAAWVEVYRKTGVRAQVRVPVRLHGQVAGGLTFHARTPGRYTLDHVEPAVRVADHIALALSHQKLAEESRRASAAQDKAAQLQERVDVLAQELESLSPHRALGRSQRWRDVLAQATLVAPTETTVLVTGESGTGKEVVARFVHRASARRDGPFVALNCAALPEQLLESELFGHEKGAFTGAVAARAGRIEQAAGGVLFLDEVGEMSPAVQAKFLRLLQEREYERLGGTRTLKADVRVLAATNRDLKAAIGQGAFREDLFYRLAVFDIALPALRERPDDIPLLVEAFLDEVGRSMGRPAAGLSEEVIEKLVAYAWPGNVRELRNAIERAVILCGGGLITSAHLPMGVVTASPPASAAGPPPAAPALSERDQILQALSRTGNNQSRAARLLGLTRAQIRARIEKHGITVSED